MDLPQLVGLNCVGRCRDGTCYSPCQASIVLTNNSQRYN